MIIDSMNPVMIVPFDFFLFLGILLKMQHEPSDTEVWRYMSVVSQSKHD